MSNEYLSAQAAKIGYVQIGGEMRQCQVASTGHAVLPG